MVIKMDIGGLSSLYSDYAETAADSASKLQDSLKTTDYTEANEDELLGACKEFESYFVEQMFKAMEKTVDAIKDENSSLGTASNTSTLVDYFKDETIQDLAATSTETQGLGLAQTLYEQMKRNYNL